MKKPRNSMSGKLTATVLGSLAALALVCSVDRGCLPLAERIATSDRVAAILKDPTVSKAPRAHERPNRSVYEGAEEEVSAEDIHKEREATRRAIDGIDTGLEISIRDEEGNLIDDGELEYQIRLNSYMKGYLEKNGFTVNEILPYTSLPEIWMSKVTFDGVNFALSFGLAGSNYEGMLFPEDKDGVPMLDKRIELDGVETAEEMVIGLKHHAELYVKENKED